MPDPRLRPATATRSSTPEARAEHVAEGLGSRPMVDIVIPRTQTAAKLRLLSRSERFSAHAEARKALAAAGFPTDIQAMTALGAGAQWEYELGVRILALAVRDPLKPDVAMFSIDDWRDSCDDDQLSATYRLYLDLEQQSDPLRDDGAGLTAAEAAALVAAAKKKDVDLLMSYGSHKLALFAISSVEQPASSPIPTS